MTTSGKSITRRNVLRIAGLSGVALATPALITRSLAAEPPIKMGSLLDATGPLGLEGRRMIKATEYAVSQINAKGGLLGRQIELKSFDTQSDIKLYTQYAQQLAMRDKVDIIQGGITSSSREAIRPIFDRTKTLYFYNTQYEGGVCDHYVFCTGTTPAQTVNHIVDYATKNWGKKTYIIAADYNYGHITADWMKKFVTANGGSVAGVDFLPLDVTNFSSTISRIQQAAPEFVLSALVGSNHLGFYRQWDAAGMKSKMPIGSSVFGLGDELEAMDVSTTDGIVTCYGFYQDLQTDAAKGFVSGLQKFIGEDAKDISELAVATYDGVMLWANAVEKAGTVETEKVISALESGITIDAPGGKVTMDPKTHHTIRPTYLAQPKNRHWEILSTFADQYPADAGGRCDLVAHPDMKTQFTPQF
ncbi:ABC transporter substrate-binding protein [Agrobacterium pusense]|uniref:urea ABC transporter substrate-binding protein n=1 Tax=Agrobacterium pusense TaxID=648995 RepID=UPI002FDDF701